MYDIVTTRFDLRIKDGDKYVLDWSHTNNNRYFVSITNKISGGGAASEATIELVHYIDSLSDRYDADNTLDENNFVVWDDNLKQRTDVPTYLLSLFAKGFCTMEYRYGYANVDSTVGMSDWYSVVVKDIHCSFPNLNTISYRIDVFSTLVLTSGNRTTEGLSYTKTFKYEGGTFNADSNYPNVVVLDIKEAIDKFILESDAFKVYLSADAPSKNNFEPKWYGIDGYRRLVYIGVDSVYLTDDDISTLCEGINGSYEAAIIEKSSLDSIMCRSNKTPVEYILDLLRTEVEFRKDGTAEYKGVDGITYGSAPDTVKYIECLTGFFIEVDNTTNTNGNQYLNIKAATGQYKTLKDKDGEAVYTTIKSFTHESRKLNFTQGYDVALFYNAFPYEVKSAFSDVLSKTGTFAELVGSDITYDTRVINSQLLNKKFMVLSDILSMNLSYPVLAAVATYATEQNNNYATLKDNGAYVYMTDVVNTANANAKTAIADYQFIENQSANRVRQIASSYVSTGTVTTLGNPQALPMLTPIYLFVYIGNKLDVTSGKYLVLSQLDVLQNGVFTTQYELLKVSSLEGSASENS